MRTFTFIIFFILFSCKTHKSPINVDYCIKPNLTSTASFVINHEQSFGFRSLNTWNSNISFLDSDHDEITYKLLTSSVSTYYSSSSLNNYHQQKRDHYRLLYSNCRRWFDLINDLCSVRNYMQCLALWLCQENKPLQFSRLSIKSSAKNYHLININSYEHHQDNFHDRKTKPTKFRTNKNNYHAQSVRFKVRRLLSEAYYDSEDEELKFATLSHTNDKNPDEKLDVDYGDDLYDDDDVDDAEEEEENQEQILYEEEPVPVRAVPARHRERLNSRHRRVAQSIYGERQQQSKVKRSRRKSYEKMLEGCEDPGKTLPPYYHDYDAEDIDLSYAETNVPLLKLVCSLATLALIDFIYQVIEA